MLLVATAAALRFLSRNKIKCAVTVVHLALCGFHVSHAVDGSPRDLCPPMLAAAYRNAVP